MALIVAVPRCVIQAVIRLQSLLCRYLLPSRSSDLLYVNDVGNLTWEEVRYVLHPVCAIL